MNKTYRAVLGLLAALAAQPLSAQQRLAMPTPPAAEIVPIALMLDLSSNQTLLARQENRRFVPASITKVMTAFTAFELIDEGRIDIRQPIAVSDAAFEEWSGKGSSMFVARGSKVPVDRLIMGITTVSANDGSVVLAEGASGSTGNWIALMNRNAHSLGMRDSRFGTPNGWPDEGYTFTTARDLATLAKAILSRHPSKFRRYFGHRGMEHNGIAQENHDPISGIVRGADGFKTGFTNQAGYGFLGTAERDGRRLVMVVAGADSGRARNDAARAFLEWGFEAFDSRLLFGRDMQIGEALVQDGTLERIGLATQGPVRIAVPKTGGKVEVSIVYRGPLPAPIARGEEIAKLRIAVEGLPLTHIPLVATQDVAAASAVARIGNAFAAIFR